MHRLFILCSPRFQGVSDYITSNPLLELGVRANICSQLGAQWIVNDAWRIKDPKMQRSKNARITHISSL